MESHERHADADAAERARVQHDARGQADAGEAQEVAAVEDRDTAERMVKALEKLFPGEYTVRETKRDKCAPV